MTEATRKALIRIDEILHEAGWDRASSPQEPASPSADLTRLRRAHETLLHHDHLDILSAILGETVTVEQFAAKMDSEGTLRRARETLRRICDFVDSCEGVVEKPESERHLRNDR